MYEHNALGFWSCLALCLTKVRSSRARCPATALICDCTGWLVSDLLGNHVVGFLMMRLNFSSI